MTGSATRHTSDAERAARIHTELGQGYFSQGRLKLALKKLQKALEFDADYTPAYTVLGALYARIGNTLKAEQAYRHAVALEPDAGTTNNNLGVFLCRHGNEAEALRHFERALADPFYATPAAAVANSGACHERAGDLQAAEAAYRKALSIDSESPEALYRLARLLHRRGDDFHASAYVQRFMALGAPGPKILILGHDVATALGRVDKANAYARRLLADYPDSNEAAQLKRDTPS